MNSLCITCEDRRQISHTKITVADGQQKFCVVAWLACSWEEREGGSEGEKKEKREEERENKALQNMEICPFNMTFQNYTQRDYSWFLIEPM